jgi:hypothetical protein
MVRVQELVDFFKICSRFFDKKPWKIDFGKISLIAKSKNVWKNARKVLTRFF